MANDLSSEEQATRIKNEKLQKWIGLGLVSLGLAGFLIDVFAGHAWHIPDSGGVPAASVLFVMVGMAFYFPDLLQGPDGGFSTMRMIVFMVVMVFVVLTIKIGWNTGSFDEFKIDNTWVYILGLAFGGKVFQAFGEKDDDKDETKKDG